MSTFGWIISLNRKIIEYLKIHTNDPGGHPRRRCLRRPSQHFNEVKQVLHDVQWRSSGLLLRTIVKRRLSNRSFMMSNSNQVDYYLGLILSTDQYPHRSFILQNNIFMISRHLHKRQPNNVAHNIIKEYVCDSHYFLPSYNSRPRWPLHSQKQACGGTLPVPNAF